MTFDFIKKHEIKYHILINNSFRCHFHPHPSPPRKGEGEVREALLRVKARAKKNFPSPLRGGVRGGGMYKERGYA